MRTPVAGTAVLLAVSAAMTSAHAGMFMDNDRPTLVWVSIRALPGEGLWQACRRVYQHDVYVVRRASGNEVRCMIDHSRIYNYGERRQNFNNSQ